VPGVSFPLAEIQSAFAHYQEVAAEAGRSGDWEPFVNLFTEDVDYIEHHYGRFKGRDQVRAWIGPAMAEWPASQMVSFPWTWHSIDVEHGWVIGEVANVMADPGDGKVYEAANWTRLVYAGEGLFSEEEDVYNPAEFASMMGDWIAAYRSHHQDDRGTSNL
jgi:hypothetical protein